MRLVPEISSPTYAPFCALEIVLCGLFGVVAVNYLGWHEWNHHASAAIWFLGLCVMVGELNPIRLSRRSDSTTTVVSITPIIALVLLGYPITAAAICLIGALLIDLYHRVPVLSAMWRCVISATAVLIYASSFKLLGLLKDFTTDSRITPRFLFLMLGTVLIVEFVTIVNATFMATLGQRLSWRELWPSDWRFHLLVTVVFASLGPVMAVLALSNGWLLPVVVIAFSGLVANGFFAVNREHAATHDSLTELPNRALFSKKADLLLQNADKTASALGLIVIDLDGFKSINDELGHKAGDELLVEVSRRLQLHLRGEDIVSRLGGDEFALMIENGTPERVVELIDALLRDIGQPIYLGEAEKSVSASVGVALYPEHGEHVEELLQKADFAMYSAKTERTGMQFYSPSEDRRRQNKGAFLQILRTDIADGKLELEFQPQIDVSSGEVIAMEALVRWYRDGRLTYPSEFVEIAEKSGVVSQITRYVVDRTLDAARRVEDEGFRMRWAVNISPRDLLEPEFVEFVKDRLLFYGIRPGSLELEVTENGLLQRTGMMVETLERLRDVGVRFALDDFGTGFATLSHLRELPFQVVKVDKSFVTHMLENPEDATIVQTTIELGQKLGLEVVAEGVETEEVLLQLRGMGCDYCQGFYICKPLRFGMLLGWLSSKEGPGGIYGLTEKNPAPKDTEQNN